MYFIFCLPRDAALPPRGFFWGLKRGVASLCFGYTSVYIKLLFPDAVCGQEALQRPHIVCAEVGGATDGVKYTNQVD